MATSDLAACLADLNSTKISAIPKGNSTSSSSSSTTPNAPGTKRMRKMRAREVGEPLPSFRGWKATSQGVVYPKDRPDWSLFVSTVCATTYGFNVHKLPHPLFLSKAENGKTWAPAITSLKGPYTINVSDMKSGIVIGNSGQKDKYFVPKCGSIVSAEDFGKVRELLETVPRLPHQSLGLSGVLKGLASPIGGDFTAWFDYILYCEIVGQPYFVSLEDRNKRNLTYFDRPVAHADLSLVREHPTVYFSTKLPPKNLGKNNNWIPFVPNATGERYFFGLGGVYALGWTSTQAPVDDFLVYVLNWMGAVAYAYLGKVATVNDKLVARVYDAISDTGIPKLDMGIMHLGHALGGSSVSASDALMNIRADEDIDLDITPITINTRYFSCGGHKNLSYLSVIREDVSQAIATERVKASEPKKFFHDEELVLEAYTVMADLQNGGKTVRAWKTLCKKCENPYLWNPEKMLEACLIDVRNDEADEEDDASDEEDEEEEEVVAVTDDKTEKSTRSLENPLTSGSDSGTLAPFNFFDEDKEKDKQKQVVKKPPEVIPEKEGVFAKAGEKEKKPLKVADTKDNPYVTKYLGHYDPDGKSKSFFLKGFSFIPMTGPGKYRACTGFKFEEERSADYGEFLGIVIFAGCPIFVHRSLKPGSGTVGSIYFVKGDCYSDTSGGAPSPDPPFRLSTYSRKGTVLKTLVLSGKFAFHYGDYVAIGHFNHRNGKQYLCGVDCSVELREGNAGPLMLASPMLLMGT